MPPQVMAHPGICHITWVCLGICHGMPQPPVRDIKLWFNFSYYRVKDAEINPVKTSLPYCFHTQPSEEEESKEKGEESSTDSESVDLKRIEIDPTAEFNDSGEEADMRQKHVM